MALERWGTVLEMLVKVLDETTLDGIADVICGDGAPYYRKGWELAEFFRRAGLSCNGHDGSTRKWWALDRLREYNREPKYMERVLLRLADPREYKGDSVVHTEAVHTLNALLAVEGLALDMVGMAPRLQERNPEMVQKKPPPKVPQTMPDLSRLVGDATLRPLLEARWYEAQRCVEAKAHLAALVLMGSLLEGTLLACINANPADANRARATPKDMNGKPKAFHDWTLGAMIDVAHECGWIQADVKDFSHALREYRNMVHPWHQRALGIVPDDDTCSICWSVVTAAVNDLSRAGRK